MENLYQPHLNSNIEIHKYNHFINSFSIFFNLNSNIEIHKYKFWAKVRAGEIGFKF